MKKKIIGFLIMFVLCTGLFTVVSATTVNEQVNVHIQTITNGSVDTIKVNGLLFACNDENCTAYVDVDCPTCPTCPTCTMDTNGLEGNITSTINAALNGHTAQLSVDDKTWFEETSDQSVASLAEVFETTYMKSEADFTTLENENTQLKEDKNVLDRTIIALDANLKTEIDKQERTSTTLLIGGCLFVVILAVLILTIVQGEGGWGSFRHRSNAGGAIPPVYVQSSGNPPPPPVDIRGAIIEMVREGELSAPKTNTEPAPTENVPPVKLDATQRNDLAYVYLMSQKNYEHDNAKLKKMWNKEGHDFSDPELRTMLSIARKRIVEEKGGEFEGGRGKAWVWEGNNEYEEEESGAEE